MWLKTITQISKNKGRLIEGGWFFMLNIFKRSDAISISTRVSVPEKGMLSTGKTSPRIYPTEVSPPPNSSSFIIVLGQRSWSILLAGLTTENWMSFWKANTNEFYLRSVVKQKATEKDCYQGEYLIQSDQLQCHFPIHKRITAIGMM
jgi:hypothetical protein